MAGLAWACRRTGGLHHRGANLIDGGAVWSTVGDQALFRFARGAMREPGPMVPGPSFSEVGYPVTASTFFDHSKIVKKQ